MPKIRTTPSWDPPKEPKRKIDWMALLQPKEDDWLYKTPTSTSKPIDWKQLDKQIQDDWGKLVTNREKKSIDWSSFQNPKEK